MERFIIKEKDKYGNIVELEGIATYHDELLNKDFIVYTDKTFDKNGKLKVYFSLYTKDDNNIKLVEVKTNEEKQIGLMLIKEIVKDLYNNNLGN